MRVAGQVHHGRRTSQRRRHCRLSVSTALLKFRTQRKPKLAEAATAARKSIGYARKGRRHSAILSPIKAARPKVFLLVFERLSLTLIVLAAKLGWHAVTALKQSVQCVNTEALLNAIMLSD